MDVNSNTIFWKVRVRLQGFANFHMQVWPTQPKWFRSNFVSGV